MLFVLPSWVTYVAAFATIGLAVVRGGRAERLVAGLLVVDILWGLAHPYIYGAHPLREFIPDGIDLKPPNWGNPA